MQKAPGLAIAALAVTAGGAAVIAAAPASAAVSTSVYACNAWSCRSVRPAEIGFGAHYDVAALSWSGWGSGTAHGRGHFYGSPTFGYGGASVTLYDVRVHNGHRYFSWIKITAPGHATRYLQYSGGFWTTR
jgi:hypothetical protein